MCVYHGRGTRIARTARDGGRRDGADPHFCGARRHVCAAISFISCSSPEPLAAASARGELGAMILPAAAALHRHNIAPRPATTAARSGAFSDRTATPDAAGSRPWSWSTATAPVRFALTPSGRLQMFLCGELCCDPVGRIDYRASDGYVDVEEAEGGVEGGAYFNLAEGEQLKQAACLGVLADLARVQWAGDAPVRAAARRRRAPRRQPRRRRAAAVAAGDAAAVGAAARDLPDRGGGGGRRRAQLGDRAAVPQPADAQRRLVGRPPGEVRLRRGGARGGDEEPRPPLVQPARAPRLDADDVRRMAGLVDGVEKLLWWKNSSWSEDYTCRP